MEWKTFINYKGFEIQISGTQYRINHPSFKPETRRFNPMDALDEIDAVTTA